MTARFKVASLLAVAMAGLAMAGLASSAQAQQGCKATALSCSQLNKACEQTCRNRGAKAESCIALYCATNMPTCKSEGVWKSTSAASACWTTTKRS